MIVMCDESLLIPSIAEARGMPISWVRGTIGERRLRATGLTAWFESIRAWHTVRGAVNDMRMFLGLSDFSSARAFRRSLRRIPLLDSGKVITTLQVPDAVAERTPTVITPSRRIA
jgi:hypothetical protein